MKDRNDKLQETRIKVYPAEKCIEKENRNLKNIKRKIVEHRILCAGPTVEDSCLVRILIKN